MLKLAQEELELERSVIILSLKVVKLTTDSFIKLSLMLFMFTHTKIQSLVVGDLYNIDHKSMKDFYDTYYHPGNAVAVLVIT